MVYDIEINLLDGMAPVAINNGRLAANSGAVMVKDVDDEDEFDNEDEDKPAVQHRSHYPMFLFLERQPWLRGRDCGIEGVGRAINHTMPTSIAMSRSLTRALHYVMFMQAPGTSFNSMPQNQMTLSTASTLR